MLKQTRNVGVQFLGLVISLNVTSINHAVRMKQLSTSQTSKLDTGNHGHSVLESAHSNQPDASPNSKHHFVSTEMYFNQAWPGISSDTQSGRQIHTTTQAASIDAKTLTQSADLNILHLLLTGMEKMSTLCHPTTNDRLPSPPRSQYSSASTSCARYWNGIFFRRRSPLACSGSNPTCHLSNHTLLYDYFFRLHHCCPSASVTTETCSASAARLCWHRRWCHSSSSWTATAT